MSNLANQSPEKMMKAQSHALETTLPINTETGLERVDESEEHTQSPVGKKNSQVDVTASEANVSAFDQ